MNQETLKKYAHTLLKYGVNLQQDQTLVMYGRIFLMYLDSAEWPVL